MNIKNFKEKFEKMLKNSDMKIKISKNGNKTIISNRHGNYFDASYNCFGFFYSSRTWRWDGFDEKVVRKNLEYWEQISLIENKPFICFHCSPEFENLTSIVKKMRI